MLEQLFKDHTKNIIICILGAFVSALAVNCFILGSNLGDGGTVGISLALKYAFGWSPALTSLIINTIVIIVGWKEKELRALRGIYSIIGVGIRE